MPCEAREPILMIDVYGPKSLYVWVMDEP